MEHPDRGVIFKMNARNDQNLQNDDLKSHLIRTLRTVYTCSAQRAAPHFQRKQFMKLINHFLDYTSTKTAI